MLASELIEELRRVMFIGGDRPVTDTDGSGIVSVSEDTILGDKDSDPDTDVFTIEFEG